MNNDTINLEMDCFLIKKHPQLVMKELGITYGVAIPKIIIDSWWFLDCKNVPNHLPDFLLKLKSSIKL